MQHGERERELMIQLSAALREVERLRDALGDAFEDRRAADRRADAAEEALAAANEELAKYRARPYATLAADLRVAAEAFAALRSALVVARDEIAWWVGEHGCCGGHEEAALERIGVALAAPAAAAGEEGAK